MSSAVTLDGIGSLLYRIGRRAYCRLAYGVAHAASTDGCALTKLCSCVMCTYTGVAAMAFGRRLCVMQELTRRRMETPTRGASK